ncbi:MAG TPA: peptide-methionine (S)-S-oxide reductase, partial [Balneolaceae bacterium]|nr:peptide-methionine (S)-S-oxide reductase [Balneolaceae bacterium]
MFKSLFISGLILGLSTLSLSAQDMDMNNEKNLEKATFGAGCFWCVEAIYEIVEGIEHVESGYSGGHIENPSYREVTSGRTGHAEVARIHFDPNVISYE